MTAGHPVTARRTGSPPGDLVGRERELAAIHDAVLRSRDGSFEVVLVAGSAGVGKSRLAAEVAARHAAQATCLSARSYRFGTTTSFGPWIEALDRHLRGRTLDEIRRLCATSAGELATLLPAARSCVATPAATEPQRPQLLDALVEVFDNLAREQPVLVTLDDVHLADTSSWEALRYLARRLDSAPIAIVATARRSELRTKAIAGEVLLGLGDDGHLDTVELAPLERDQVALLAREAARSRSDGTVPAVPEALVTWLMSRTLGYPLFVVTLLEALLDEGGDLAQPRLSSVPDDLRDRVELELRAIDDDARSLLETLAVVDQRADRSLLAELTGWGAHRLDAALDQLYRSTLVTRHGSGAEALAELAHPIMQEAVYGGIGDGRRGELHAAVGSALLDAGRLGPAAAHLARSAVPGDAETVESLCSAMRQADERGLYQETLAVLAALLDVLPEGDPRWRQVLDALAPDAEWVTSHLAESDAATAIAAVHRIQAALTSGDDPSAHASAHFHLATSLSFGAGELEPAEQACRRAIALYEEAGRDDAALLARNELAWIRAAAGDLPEAAALADDVLDESLDVGHLPAGVLAAGTRAYVLGLMGDFGEAEACFRHSIDLAAAAGNAYRVAWGRTQLGFALQLAGHVEEGTTCVEAALLHDQSAADAIAHEVLAHGAWLAGDLRAAIEQVERSVVRRPVGTSRRRAWALALAARLFVETDRPDRARRHLEQAERAYGGRPFMAWSVWCDWAAGTLHHHGGDLDAAAAALDRTAARLAAIGARAQEPLVLVDRAEVAAEAGDEAAAAAASERLGTLATEVGGGLHPALAGLGAAWASLARGDGDAAAGEALAAATAFGDGGYGMHRAVALVARGRALVELDRDEAVVALEDGAAALQACGAVWRREAALAHLAALGSRGRRAAASVRGPDSLTGREREVARLAAKGFTAREIGAELFIGVRTVESHLASTYSKLGVASKRELVRRAADLGL